MVQVIENWSEIRGRVRELRPDPELPGQLLATVDVEDAQPVAKPDGGTFPNLLEDCAGSAVDVYVPEETATQHGLSPGATISARVRRATPTRSFVDPGSLLAQ